MHDYMNVTVRLTGAALVMALFSACTSVSVPTQLAEATTGYQFDQSRTTFGERLALAEAGFNTRVEGVNAYAAR